MNEPITKRVLQRKSKNFPVNQEVTMNADGSGGPINLSPLKKKDACYHKVKARYDVFPSAYASGAIAACRKKGAANWGKSSPAKQTTTPPPGHTDKLYEKAAKLQSKAEKAAAKGKNKKAARLENRVARVEKREKKKRAKYNY